VRNSEGWSSHKDGNDSTANVQCQCFILSQTEDVLDMLALLFLFVGPALIEAE